MINNVKMTFSDHIFRVILSPLQAHQFSKVLDQVKAETGTEGVLCTVARIFDAASGGTVLELQAARLSRGATRKIQKIISEELAPKKSNTV